MKNLKTNNAIFAVKGTLEITEVTKNSKEKRSTGYGFLFDTYADGELKEKVAQFDKNIETILNGENAFDFTKLTRNTGSDLDALSLLHDNIIGNRDEADESKGEANVYKRYAKKLEELFYGTDSIATPDFYRIQEVAKRNGCPGIVDNDKNEAIDRKRIISTVSSILSVDVKKDFNRIAYSQAEAPRLKKDYIALGEQVAAECVDQNVRQLRGMQTAVAFIADRLKHLDVEDLSYRKAYEALHEVYEEIKEEGEYAQRNYEACAEQSSVVFGKVYNNLVNKLEKVAAKAGLHLEITWDGLDPVFTLKIKKEVKSLC